MKDRLKDLAGKLIERIQKDLTEEMTRGRTVAAVLACCAIFGWWGAVYPQFTLLSGTYRIVDEADGVIQEEAGKTAKDEADARWEYAEEQDGIMDKGALYWRILGADSDHIRIKSRLWENWKALWGAERE